jgi:hypothetical protein
VRQLFRIAANASWDPAVAGQIRLRFENMSEEIVVEVRPRESL